MRQALRTASALWHGTTCRAPARRPSLATAGNPTPSPPSLHPTLHTCAGLHQGRQRPGMAASCADHWGGCNTKSPTFFTAPFFASPIGQPTTCQHAPTTCQPAASSCAGSTSGPILTCQNCAHPCPSAVHHAKVQPDQVDIGMANYIAWGKAVSNLNIRAPGQPLNLATHACPVCCSRPDKLHLTSSITRGNRTALTEKSECRQLNASELAGFKQALQMVLADQQVTLAMISIAQATSSRRRSLLVSPHLLQHCSYQVQFLDHQVACMICCAWPASCGLELCMWIRFLSLQVQL